jgi:hypothetical protein
VSAVARPLRKSRLAELLDAPGGLRVGEALERANHNLDALKDSCQVELRTLLDHADRTFAELGETFDEPALAALYVIAARGIGAGGISGAPAVDEALVSLCDLLDHLISSGRCGREAIEVHLSAWRLLVGPQAPRTGGWDVMLQGLRRVSTHYAPQAA